MAKLDKMITYAYLREECDMPENLPDSDVEHLIYRAQEMLRMLMGDGFYQDFLTAYRTVQPFSSSVYQNLFDPYIKQFIAWQAHEFWVPKANFRKHLSGFRVHREDDSEPASDIQMATLIKDAKQQSQYYKNLFGDYLNNHYADYPLYDYSCRDDKRGNGFHISAVKNKNYQPQPYGTGGTFKKCCNG